MSEGAISKKRRSKKVELVKYLPEPKALEGQARLQTFSAVNLSALRPGDKIKLELEVLQESDDHCLALNITAKDGPKKQVFTDLLFKVKAVEVSTVQ